MDHTKVMELAERSGGLFRLAVLLQKRVRELVNGSPKLIETDELDPINIAMLEVEAKAIELVDLSDEEVKQLEVESQMASEEAELLEALRSRVTRAALPAGAAPAAGAPPEEQGGEPPADIK